MWAHISSASASRRLRYWSREGAIRRLSRQGVENVGPPTNSNTIEDGTAFRRAMRVVSKALGPEEMRVWRPPIVSKLHRGFEMRRLRSFICACCQKPFETRNSNPLFCSSSCAAKVNNRVAPKRKPKSKHPCEICATMTMRRRFCCVRCKNDSQKKYATEQERLKANRAIKNEAWQRYMARRRNQTPIDVDVSSLQKFYLTCPDGHEVDHKIPLSKGGLHCPSNLQHLPKSINRRKGAKILPEYIGEREGVG